MNELQIIDERTVLGKDFKMYGDIENPLFLAKDVAEWIEYNSSSANKMLSSIDDDEKLVGTIFRSGQRREMWFLTEDGLYEVLMQSRKPIAKQFKKQVKRILKQIRHTGGYIPTSVNDTNEEILSKALLIAQNTIEQKNILLHRQTLQIEEMRPKVNGYDTFLKSAGYVSLNKVAKSLHKGRNRMMKFLREQGILFKDGNENIAYQRYCNAGYFTIDYKVGRDGLVHAVTKVSAKGVDFIKRLYEKTASQEVA